MAIAVTGATGFIGSCLVSYLKGKGLKDLVLVDDFSQASKMFNLNNKTRLPQIHRDDFLKPEHFTELDFVFHIGARTDTSELNTSIFDRLNLHYSQKIWELCSQFNIPLIYASSAATYGAGEKGFNDDHEVIAELKPLNPYGQSKQDFDCWVLEQKKTPPFWCGLKFFNVFGPNEYHKDRMASVVFHAFNQIRSTGKLKLFQSHHPDFKDGEQKRDFIYVKDLLELIWFHYTKQKRSGIFNAGSGKAETFLSLARAVFSAMKQPEQIDFIPTPIDIRENYQYFTEATMKKNLQLGYDKGFHNLETAVKDYVQHYLKTSAYF